MATNDTVFFPQASLTCKTSDSLDGRVGCVVGRTEAALGT